MLLWGARANCIKVYTRGQISKIYLHFDSLEMDFWFNGKSVRGSEGDFNCTVIYTYFYIRYGTLMPNPVATAPCNYYKFTHLGSSLRFPATINAPLLRDLSHIT